MNYIADAYNSDFITVVFIYASMGLLGGFCALIYGYWRYASFQIEAFLIVFTMTTIGGLSGYLGGASRVGTVGDIVPAFIGLLGGVAAYLFGIKSENREIVALSVLGFSVTLFMGFAYGADSRSSSEYNQSFVEACQNIMFAPESYHIDNTLSQRLENREDPLVAGCTSFFQSAAN